MVADEDLMLGGIATAVRHRADRAGTVPRVPFRVYAQAHAGHRALGCDAARYAASRTDLLVTSAQYYAPTRDVQVRIFRRAGRNGGTTLRAR